MSTLKKKEAPLKIDSDDTEGSDLSYESSFDEKGEQEPQEDKQKNFQLFKEQMVRFLLTHPELSDEIRFQPTNYEDDVFWENPRQNSGLNSPSNQQTKNFSNNNNNNEVNEQYNNPLWQSIAGNLIQESKRQSSIPSIESFTQRLNLFRRKVEKPDVIDIIIKNKDSLLKQISKEKERKEQQQTNMHKTIEAKLIKDAGDVVYYSLRKQYELKFRINQEKNKQKIKEEKNNASRQNTQQSDSGQQQQQQQPQQQGTGNQYGNMRTASQDNGSNNNKGGRKKKFASKGPSVFDRLGGGKKVESDTEKQIPLDMEFKTPKGEELYRMIQKAQTEEAKKQIVIEELIKHREKTKLEFEGKHSLLQQGQKYYSEESKEFSLLAPNQQTRQIMAESGIINDEFFEHRANLEDGNVYLLTKVNKILNGSLMKKWKNIQDSQF